MSVKSGGKVQVWTPTQAFLEWDQCPGAGFICWEGKLVEDNVHCGPKCELRVTP